jgi:hypothetical protein
MTIATKLHFKGYLNLMYHLTYRNSIMVFLTMLGLVMFFGSILYFVGIKIPVDSPPYFQLIFGFFVLGFIPLSVYRKSKKNFFSHGKLQEKIIYEFTDEKITLKGETFHSEMEWTKIYIIAELKDWILIYQNRQIANLIPKGSFGDKIDEFKTLVKKKAVKAKLRK